MVVVETFSKNQIEIDQKEVLRYLGYQKEAEDEKVLKEIESLTEKIREELSLKVCYEKYPLELKDEYLRFGMVKTDSESLKKNLDCCSEVIVFAATIGIGADRLIGKYSATSPLDAVICQAVGTTYIEALCDSFLEKLEKAEEGRFLRPRFSPGYGDFGVENQKEIFSMLDATRKIGVSLTESLQMVPSKSVTAVVGISEKKLSCTKKGCEECLKTDCCYRR